MDYQNPLNHHRCNPAITHFPGYMMASPPRLHAAVIPQQQQQEEEENRAFQFKSVACGFGAGQPDPEFPDGSSPKASGISIEPAKRKRGRPRKITALSPAPVPAVAGQVDSGSGGASAAAVAAPSSENQAKKTRGRPPGSVKKQRESSVEADFTPHVITVNIGEDIAQTIMAFSQQGGARTVCVLSANGAVSYVTLRQPGGYVTLEGRFDIVSLSGSFFLSESNGSRVRSGGLSVSLAGADGIIVGGGVSGRLTAASPVQVVMASFIADGKRPKQTPSPTLPPPLLPLNMLSFGAPLLAGDVSSPPSEGPSSESYEENNGNSSHDSASFREPRAMYANMGWPNNDKMLP